MNLYVGNLDNHSIQEIGGLEEFTSHISDNLCNRICISTSYYIDRLKSKDYVLSSNKTKGRIDLTSIPNTFNVLNDYIFEEYAHRHSDLVGFIKEGLNRRSIQLDYGFDSTNGTPYYVFTSIEHLNSVIDFISSLEV